MMPAPDLHADPSLPRSLPACLSVQDMSGIFKQVYSGQVTIIPPFRLLDSLATNAIITPGRCEPGRQRAMRGSGAVQLAD